MVQILPLEDKLKIQSYCLQFGVDFLLSSSAYVAIEDGDAIGICLFEIKADSCVIRAFKILEEYSNTFVPYLLIRSVVHFAYECDIDKLIIESEDISCELAEKSGFELVNEGANDCRIYNYKGHIDR